LPRPVTLPIEVKNIRHWVYPTAQELFQLLYKAAALAERVPDERILPLLVCRRRSWTTLQMGNDLGFAPIESQRQFLLPSDTINAARLDAVRAVLGYRDLTVSEDADDNIVAALTRAVPPRALALADRWREVGSRLKEQYAYLRNSSITSEDRS